VDSGEIAERCGAILRSVRGAIVGNDEPLSLILAAILAGGHVLIEDLPGLGKTLTARTFAQVLGLEFRRVQFTPDLLPADVTGSYVFDQREARFEFRPGPIFTNLLLADEINRTPPRTQSALLEAMQEHQVSVEGVTTALPQPFHVIATANPIEFEGTYSLPEAQLDRFLVRVAFGYLGHDGEVDIVHRRLLRAHEDQFVDAVVDAPTLLEMQRSTERVAVEASIEHYVVALGRATRAHPSVLVGASPRGALAVVLCARALAVIEGRGFVIPDDVKRVAIPALSHRLTLRPEAQLHRITSKQVVAAVLDEVPTPVTASVPQF
jgi:MoxR-like ATPase